MPETDDIGDPLHEVTWWKLLQCQVCSYGTWEEALDWVRATMPAGTAKNWQKDDRPKAAPVACSKGGGRTHYMFMC